MRWFAQQSLDVGDAEQTSGGRLQGRTDDVHQRRERRAELDVRCFRLTASEAVLRSRIINRPAAEGSHEWCLGHLPTGLALMRDAFFGEEMTTLERSPAQVAEAITATLL